MFSWRREGSIPLTLASQIMLPIYIFLSMLFGLVYVFNPLHRLGRVPSLTYQRMVMPMPVWGLIFLGLAATMTLAWALQSLNLFAKALSICAVVWFGWGCLYVGSIFHSTDASLLSPILPWFVTAACIASTRSILHGET